MQEALSPQVMAVTRLLHHKLLQEEEVQGTMILAQDRMVVLVVVEV